MLWHVFFFGLLPRRQQLLLFPTGRKRNGTALDLPEFGMVLKWDIENKTAPAAPEN